MEIVNDGDASSSDDEEEQPTVEVLRKTKRKKVFLIFHGDRKSRRLPHSVRIKLPRDESWLENAPKKLLEAFGDRYREVYQKELGDAHLVNAQGLLVAPDDCLEDYCENGGSLNVVSGKKLKEQSTQIYQWGYKAQSISQKRVTMLDCGWLHAAALLETGKCVAWGDNSFGQLGTGDEQKSATPIKCELPRGVVLTHVCCGSYFTTAIDSGGDLWSWGRYQPSNFPKLFKDSWANGKEGIKNEKISLVACGESHTIVSTASNKLYSWGYNERWQLGRGQQEPEKEGQQKPKECKVKGSVTALAAGGGHSCAVVDGKLYAWGSNSEGQIGMISRDCFGDPQEISSMEHEQVTSVTCGRYATLAITKEGNAFLWGSLQGSKPASASSGEDEKQVEEEGEAPHFGSSNFENILGGATKQLVSTDCVGACVGEAHGLILTKDNVCQGWGYNAYGQATNVIDPQTDAVEKPTSITGIDYSDILSMIAAGGTSTLLIRRV